MLDVLTILEYARKGALADYEKACVMHRLLNIKETQAMVDNAWGTAKELTRLMNLKAEQVKQTGRDIKEDARKRVVSADRFVQHNEQVKPQQSPKAPQTGAQRMKQAIKEAPYVLVVKWNNPIMGEMEYPCKSYAEAEKSFEVAKREVHNGNVTEAHVYEQSEGQRVPVMGILSGKL